jgi:hypothetical protein
VPGHGGFAACIEGDGRRDGFSGPFHSTVTTRTTRRPFDSRYTVPGTAAASTPARRIDARINAPGGSFRLRFLIVDSCVLRVVEFAPAGPEIGCRVTPARRPKPNARVRAVSILGGCGVKMPVGKAVSKRHVILAVSGEVPPESRIRIVGGCGIWAGCGRLHALSLQSLPRQVRLERRHPTTPVSLPWLVVVSPYALSTPGRI